MAAITGAVIGGVGALGGAAMSAKAAKKAGKAQERAAQASALEQQRQYDVAREDMAPYREAGTAALNRLTDPAASFESSPGYQFARDQGLDAIKTQQNALGRLASGNTLAALTNYSQGLASQEYNNWWNQQSGLAGAGLGATNQLAGLGANTAANVGNALMAGADARASGIAGSANAWGNAFGTLGGLAQNYADNRRWDNRLNLLQGGAGGQLTGNQPQGGGFVNAELMNRLSQNSPLAKLQLPSRNLLAYGG